MSKLNIIIVAAVISSIITSVLDRAIPNFNEYKYDYTNTVTVDKAEKIEQAISNCVNDVKSRNFKVIRLEVLNVSTNLKSIKCSGITGEHLLQ